MNSPSLNQFLQAMAADPALQAKCAPLTNLTQLVQLAQEAGFAITARDLQLWAHHEAFDSPLVAVGRRQSGAAHGVFSWPALGVLVMECTTHALS
jgi:predicted ribosomally synthesized peptide with nif11-like leader